jgi:hypothetical protein
VCGRVGRIFRDIIGENPNVKMDKERGGGSFVEEREETMVKMVGLSTFFPQNSPLFTVWLYIGRTFGGDCDYRRVNRSSVAGGSGST